MTKIQTAQLGTVEIDEQDILTFTPGLLGLDQYVKYIVLQPDEKLPFVYLQCVEDPEVCLLLANPFEFYRDYQFELGETDVKDLHRPAEQDISIWVTVSATDSLKTATINLLAPIVINSKSKVGRQVVLQNTSYQTKAPLIAQIKEGA